MVAELLGASEVGQLLGVTRQRVDQLARQEGFPRPVAELAGGRVWARDDVEAWLAAHPVRRPGRRPGRPPSAPAT